MIRKCEHNNAIFTFGTVASSTLMPGSAMAFTLTGNGAPTAGLAPALLLTPVCRNRSIEPVCLNTDGSITYCPTPNAVRINKSGIYRIHYEADVSSSNFDGSYPTYGIMLNVNNAYVTEYFDYLYSTDEISHANISYGVNLVAGAIITLVYFGVSNPNIVNGKLVINKLTKDQIYNYAQFSYLTPSRNKIAPIVFNATTIPNLNIKISDKNTSIIKLNKSGIYHLHLYAGFIQTNNNAQFPASSCPNVVTAFQYQIIPFTFDIFLDDKLIHTISGTQTNTPFSPPSYCGETWPFDNINNDFTFETKEKSHLKIVLNSPAALLFGVTTYIPNLEIYRTPKYKCDC